ncbi:MAG TPA: M1 family aminopeptidase [Terriglobia bacterium]|nr:M1 family aminopeptidase [Terriglobia bacterium]
MLMKVYAQLRQLAGSNQAAAAENVDWKKDAATFHFANGQMKLAAPVAGRVLGAVFTGSGNFELDPPTPAEQHQISRFAKTPKLNDAFHQAVFLFTDDSLPELQKLMEFQPRGDATAAGKALDDVQKKFSESFNDWTDNVRSGNFQVQNLPARMLADLTDPTSRGFFLADFKGAHSGNLLFVISWNRPTPVLPSLANDEEETLIHYDRGSYWEWWAGFHISSEYVKSPWPEHLTRLGHCSKESIEAVINDHARLSATAEMQAEVPSVPLRLLPLNLRGVLRIQSVTDGSGAKLAFIQEDRKRDSDPWAILPAPAEPGRSFTLKIAYAEDSTADSHIIKQRGSGLYYVTARESWYPNFGGFNDRTEFHLRITCPKRYELAATGRLVKSQKDHDTLTTEWDSQIPLPVAGFNYGEFVTKSASDSNLTVNAYAGKEIPNELKEVQNALDVAGMVTRGDAASRYGILTGGFNTASNASHAAKVSLAAMRLYEDYFGPLPFKTISVTEQPVRGYAQSWPTLIFLPYDSMLDSTTRNNLHLQDSGEEREFYNLVAAHEMSHQWWGHLVGWKTYQDQWLSEGFAEFSSALYLQTTEPKKWDDFWDLKRKWLLGKDRAGVRPVDVGPVVLNYQLDSYLEPSAAEHVIYEKGAYILEMLRMILQDTKSKNPDATFISLMRDFTSTYAGKNAGTADFQRVVEKHLGQPMDWFFNEWVYGDEIPTYDFSYKLQDEGSGKTTVSFTLTQSGVSDSFQMGVPLYVTYQGRTGRIGFVQMKGSSTRNAHFQLPFHPSNINIDAERNLLAVVHE